MFRNAQLAALTAIIKTGSFEAAASRLGLTQSAISQRIRTLENTFGAPVVERTIPIKPTTLGARLAAHADTIDRLNSELAQELGHDQELTIGLAVNADSVDTWFLPALSGIENCTFHIKIEDQDHSAELLRRGEVAAAVTTRADPVHGADVIPLGALRYLATASPHFARSHFAEGPTPRALSTSPALVFSSKDTLQSEWARRACGQRISLNAHYLPSTQGFVTAAKLGIGWGLNPEPLVRDAIKKGELINLAPHLPFDTPLFWQSSRIGRGALTELTKNVKSAARRYLIRS